MEVINTIGRRKASVARIYMKAGSGKITVNGKDYKDYFPQANIQFNLEDPLNTVDAAKSYDIQVNVKGGGFKGQAEAVRLAVSKALVIVNEDNKKPLKEKKYLTRDSRVVERKKYGKPKARKSFQFSKR
ncbi:MAG: 30S ribosomal protein S9 [Saprospiraceae bacterium]|nr:30S ribosomal protein S9 [Bacteroidia bacterium]NNE13409.1 30S ribosomal protein S9 [Saprospiraceae bacterium]NNL92047.1 30S ribosomal protein S9 [Saprospiraceae bacterium]